MSEIVEPTKTNKQGFTKDDAIGIGIGLTVVAFFAGIIGLAIKQEIDADKQYAADLRERQAEREAEAAAAEARRQEINDWENEQRRQGRVLYKLSDGRVLSVDATAAQETLIR